MADEQIQVDPAAVEAAPQEELPVLTVRDTVIFPGAMLPITVGRPASVALVQSLGENRMMAVVSQLDPRVDVPGPEDLYQVGTVCVMHKAIRVPKENLLLFCEGIARIRTRDFTSSEPFLKARVERIAETEPQVTPEIEALRQNVIGLFQQIVAASPNLSDDLATSAGQIAEPGRLADFVAGNLPALGHPERQKLLEQTDGARAPERSAPASHARAGAGRAARAHPIAGAGTALPEPARVLPARAVEGHSKGTGRRRRFPARRGGPPQEAGGRRPAGGGQDRSHARAGPARAHVAGLAGVWRRAHLPGVDRRNCPGTSLRDRR